MDIESKPQRPLINFEVVRIVSQIAADNGLSVIEVMDRKTRKRGPAYCRFEAMAQVRAILHPSGWPMFTMVDIGKMFGTDHTSVVHACRRHNDVLKALAISRRMAETPTEVIQFDRAVKRVAVKERLSLFQKHKARPRATAEAPAHTPPRDERHVAACLAQGGFCHYSEVQLGVARNGSRLMAISEPIIWPFAEAGAARRA